MNTTTHNPKPITYNNNPFTHAFNQLGNAFKINQNPAIFVLVSGFVIGIVNQILGYLPDAFSVFIDDSDQGSAVAFGAFFLMFTLVYIPVNMLISIFLNGLTSYIGVTSAKGVSVDLKTALRQTLSKFWPMLGIGIIVGIISTLFFLPALMAIVTGIILSTQDQDVASTGLYIFGAVLAIGAVVMTIRFGLARSLSLYALYDNAGGVFASMRQSVQLTKGRLIETWGMAFVGVIPIIGQLLAGCGLGGHYLQLKVYKTHGVALPKTHFLSWLPLILLSLLLSFIALFLIFIGVLIASRQ